MRSIILRVCGTFGSGKTTAVRQFINDYPSMVMQANNKIMGYCVDLYKCGIVRPLYVVGKYDNVCGGTDSINTQLEVAERVMKAHSHGHVIYEGALVSASGLGGKVTQITQETGDTVYAFLDTPEEKCIERVIKRRIDAGNEKEFNPKNLIHKYKSVIGCRKNLLAANYNVVDVDHLNCHNDIIKIIKDFEND